MHVISQVDEDRAIERLRTDRETSFSRPNALNQLAGATPNALRQVHRGFPGVADIQAIVASLAVHCSMEKAPKSVGNVDITGPSAVRLRRGTRSAVARPDSSSELGDGRPGKPQVELADLQAPSPVAFSPEARASWPVVRGWVRGWGQPAVCSSKTA
jgi:hypothetical protein